VLAVGPASAEEPAPADEPTSPAVEPVKVPPKVVEPATPEYPPEALAERPSGRVTVKVVVETDGSVSEVEYLSGGPEVFVAPAIEAARRVRFTPGTIDGAPMRWRLAVHFDFSPPAPTPAPPAESEPPVGYEEIVIYAERSLASTETHAVATMGIEDLERASGEDLGETIGGVPGVVVQGGNSDSTKPIIRGQVERRLLVLFDGVRHESQKWGLDHATEIDPFAAGEIHVIKGAAGVRYGPDAIGGVVLVDPPALRADYGVGGKAQLVGASNGQRGVAAARLDGASAALPGFAWRLEGNYGRGAAISTPTYVLGNTGSEEWNAGATLGYKRDLAEFTASYHHFDLTSGVCYCVQSGTPDEFLAQIDADAPVGADAWTTTYDIGRPYQAVSHDIAMARGKFAFKGGATLTATYAYQSNRRQEYDHAREAVTGPQYDFTLRTHSLDALLKHGGFSTRAGWELDGGVGLSGTFQENVYRGLPLIPNFRAFQGGVFAFERAEKAGVLVEAGARYDHLSRTAFLTPSAYERSLARDTLHEGDCEVGDTAASCEASYDAASASLGALWHVVPQRVDARLDLSSATRFPNADELYMNGSAPTFPVYALGDPSLGPETTWGASPTIGLRLVWVEAEVSAYANYIDDFVYFAPEIGDDGSPAVDVTVQGAFPRFSYRPIDALFYGTDGGVTFGPESVVGLRVQGALVRAIDAGTGGALVMIPADRVATTAKLSPPDLGPMHAGFVEVTGLYVFKQTHVDLDADLAPPPEGYFLLDAALGVEIPAKKGRRVKVGLEAHNLLNARYRDYSSLLRYYADAPGRDVRLRVGFDF
jgi:iron complex outermembrane receptor protein